MEKKSFIFYKEWWDMLSKLPTDDYRHAVLTAVVDYAFTGQKPEDPIILGLTMLMFSAVDRDTEKWNDAKKRRSEAGRKGAEKTNEKRWGASAKVGNAEQTSAKSAVNVNDNVNVSVNENVNVDVNEIVNVDKDVVSLDDELEYFQNKPEFMEGFMKNYDIDRETLQSELEEFKMCCLARGTQRHESMHDAMRHFSNWMTKRRGIHSIKKVKKNGFRLGYDEKIDPLGRRTYGSGATTVPLDAPPRPGATWAWNAIERKWENLL